jgi:hypothetical protein
MAQESHSQVHVLVSRWLEGHALTMVGTSGSMVSLAFGQHHIRQVPAQRDYNNRPRGTLEWKNLTMLDKERYIYF